MAGTIMGVVSLVSTFFEIQLSTLTSVIVEKLSIPVLLSILIALEVLATLVLIGQIKKEVLSFKETRN